MTLSHLQFPRARLAAMDADERVLLLLFGHVLNELSTLRKLTLFATSSISGQPYTSNTETDQAVYVMRLLGGKTYEAWLLFTRLFQHNQNIANKYTLAVDNRCGEKRLQLKRYFSMPNVITHLRKHHAFRYPRPQDIEKSFADVSKRETCDFFISDGVVNSFYNAGDLVALTALVSAIGGGTFEESIERLRDEVLQTTGEIEDLLSAVIISIIDSNFPDIVAREIEVGPGEVIDIRDVHLPFYVDLSQD